LDSMITGTHAHTVDSLSNSVSREDKFLFELERFELRSVSLIRILKRQGKKKIELEGENLN